MSHKKLYINLFAILFCSSLFLGCDPMKSILITNQTKKDITVEIIQEANNLSLGNESEMKFHLKSAGDSSEIRHIYGFGSFSKEEIEEFNASIQRIQIHTKTDTCIIEGEDLNKFLTKKRKYLLNNELEVKIKDCKQ